MLKVMLVSEADLEVPTHEPEGVQLKPRVFQAAALMSMVIFLDYRMFKVLKNDYAPETKGTWYSLDILSNFLEVMLRSYDATAED